MRLQTALLPLLLAPVWANAAGFNGAELSLMWGIPFALILLSIATGHSFLHTLGIIILAKSRLAGHYCFCCHSL